MTIGSLMMIEAVGSVSPKGLRPPTTWGIDATATIDDGHVTVFASVDHCTAECVGVHAVKRATGFEMLELSITDCVAMKPYLY